ncbi:hypothetical protein GCM10025868_34730 [Angustibacter aerolatus]|uniref:Galactose-1-phosphate uridylyltransferase n=1 Tax=Angustibacter aerolatus TaxID=1162965 RepID=A0ABQ6JJQ0_9ACTN|nr:hypothetical protein [Angustibacter aerolatus]GMA88223.1 hypothetical protein GCM10025868_34730 [Angustibacter aerolatus]
MVTNSVPVADLMHDPARHDRTVILVGGQRTPSDALVGPVAVAALRSLHVDTLVLGCHGIAPDVGLTTPNVEEAETDRALLQSARRLVVAADHTKWGVVGLAGFAALEEIDVLVTDRGLARSAQRVLSRSVGRLVVADDDEPGAGRTRPRPPRRRRRTRGGGGMTTEHRVRRSVGTLTDGREIIYFDDTEPYLSGEATRVVPDRRPLGPAGAAGERRYDPLAGEWVVIAAHRMDRTFLPPADECPLCPTGRGSVPSEVPADGYDVVVFENRFPSLSTRTLDGIPSTVDDEPLVPRAPAFGRCEVVCFTDDHGGTFADLTTDRARTVVEAWADRTREPVGPRRRRVGVPLREPRQGDRRHAGAPTRPDLRLPVRAAAHRAACCGWPASTASAPAATSWATCWPPSGAAAAGCWSTASTGRRTCRPPRAGRSRCT